MKQTEQIANHIRGVHFGGNWCDSNLKDQVSDLTWYQATSELYGLNTIAKLVFHMNYFVKAVSEVLEGKPFSSKDTFSFDVPRIQSEADWDDMVNNALDDAERFAQLIEALPEEMLEKDFTDPKYGTYQSNLIGILEHCHYHLGQIVLIKKILKQKERQ
jgi:hypothetical protein